MRRNVEFGLRQTGCTAAQVNRRAEAALSTVGLLGRASSYPHTLSGGMRQRVALARVLALEPKALLMDEPFGALDALARERLQDELLDLWTRHARTVFYVTHSVEEAVYLADRVLLMGPPPQSHRRDRTVSLPRPRNRLSAEFAAAVQLLRNELDRLPCCVVARDDERELRT